jgi:hypothetical protein
MAKGAVMFAPKVAKPEAKAAESPSNLTNQRWTPSARAFSSGTFDRPHMVLPSIGNQAAPPLLSQHGFSCRGKETELDHERQAEPTIDQKAPRGLDWSLSRISIFPPDASFRFPTGVLQPKLGLGSVDDPLEHEADRLAHQVMQMPDPTLSLSSGSLQSSRKCTARPERDVVKLQMKTAGAARLQAGEAPSSVHKVLQSQGQPLDTASRAYFEPRFGHDFSRVRVHYDAKGAVSASDVGARAYTVGERIVFGSGEFAPHNAVGRRLLAHELAHVVQQASAGTACVQRAPLTYGNTAVTITPPAKPFTLQDAKNLIQQRINANPPVLTKADVKGAPPGSDAEIFLWYILAQVAGVLPRGTETDLIEPIGWPPPPASATSTSPAPTGPASATPTPPGSSAPGPVVAPAPSAPVAAVTVRIDEAGAGVAELISTKPIGPAKTYPKPDDGKADLIATYGLKSVSDGDATWTADELNRVAGRQQIKPR